MLCGEAVGCDGSISEDLFLRDREDVRIWRWNDIKNSSRVDEVVARWIMGGQQ